MHYGRQKGVLRLVSRFSDNLKGFILYSTLVFLMGKWFRCPICGRLSLERSIDRDLPIETFNQVGLGRARGFRYDRIIDVGLIERIKNKVKFLYERFFGPVSLVPGLRSRGGVRARGGARAPGGILLRPGISTEPVVRDI